MKIFVGDLVNKGPKNLQVLRYLEDNGDHCLSVRGNHDDFVLKFHGKWQQEPEKTLLEPRNAWIIELTNEDVNFLRNLPYTISLPTLKAIVVHAGLLPSVDLDHQTPLNMTKMRNVEPLTTEEKQEYKASESTNEGLAWASVWPGPEHIYFGHDAVRRLQKLPHATGLDTGAVYGGQLTGTFISGPRQGELVQVPAQQVWLDPLAEKQRKASLIKK